MPLRMIPHLSPKTPVTFGAKALIAKLLLCHNVPLFFRVTHAFMLPEFTISCVILKNFLGGGPPNPPSGEGNHLYHLTTL